MAKPNEIEKSQIRQLLEDPVLWARVFCRTFDPMLKKVTPWIARWYQEKILRDPSKKKVARCGRRTGKSDTMVIDSMWRTHTKPKYRALFVTPYENQIRLIFIRIKEIIEMSPELKKDVVKMTFNPYMIQWTNGSMIIGFTTGASSGSAGASIRGQRADYLYVDEADYLGEGDFDTVSMIAAERPDIGLFVSSTPTGKRGLFYQLCTNPKMGYTEHYHPSTDNPNWSDEMEHEFRAQLSEQAYVHEVLAEFGTEASGVFSKESIDAARQLSFYHYAPLNQYEIERCAASGQKPQMLVYNEMAPYNVFRTMGVDWDKFKASSSIVILDFLPDRGIFRVTKRIEVPRSEYSYDKAIQTIVELNNVYRPSWIYCDRGAAEYQIERLHIIGDENPSTGLKNKVKGWQFKQTIDVMDPHTKQIVREPMKPFMVNQLSIAFERNKIALSPFDDIMYKQLIDYHMVRIGQTGAPVYSDENEHSIDALGLAFLAFVLEFPDLVNQVKRAKFNTVIKQSNAALGAARLNQLFNDKGFREEHGLPQSDPRELRGDKQSWFKTASINKGAGTSSNWGARSSGMRGGGRSLW